MLAVWNSHQEKNRWKQCESVLEFDLRYEATVQCRGNLPDSQLILLCRWCIAGADFVPMCAYKDGRFVCIYCAHTVRPECLSIVVNVPPAVSLEALSRMIS